MRMRAKALMCGMANTKKLSEFSIKFRARRLAFNFTQSELAAAAGVSRRTIVSAERAEQSDLPVIGARCAYKIAEVLALKGDSLADKRVVALVPPPARITVPS